MRLLTLDEDRLLVAELNVCQQLRNDRDLVVAERVEERHLAHQVLLVVLVALEL